MTAPTITRAQLEPLLERVLRGVDETAPLVLVRGDPSTAPASASVGGLAVDVVASSSPLEIRARAAAPRHQPLVVVTGCDTSTLGDDLLARSVRRKVHAVDRWRTVANLFGAEHVSRSLSEHTALADTVIEAKPLNGYPRIPSRVLDLDTVLDALVHTHLHFVGESLAHFLAWGETAHAARTVRATPPPVSRLLEAHLVRQLGAGVSFVFAAIRSGHGADVMAYALAADVIHHTDGSFPEAAVRLDVALENAGLSGDVARSIGAAAVERVKVTPADQSPAGFWLSGADALLNQWNAAAAAVHSDVLPSGFDQRIGRAALLLTAWRANPGRGPLADAADAAIEHAGAHLRHTEQPQRVERQRMAARLIRRGRADLDSHGTLTQQLLGYTTDGAWLDRARIAVSQSDPDPAMAALCRDLTEWADSARIAQGAALARISAGAAQPLGGGLLGVEQVLDDVVAPLAATRPVLLVVLDGMSWPVFTEVITRLRQQGWGQYQDAGRVAARPVVAALPTVTELSRTSLLCGRLRSGDKESERRAFSAHPALLTKGTKAHPPLLFHKTDLRSGGLDTRPHDALEATLDNRTQVVGLVLNNIDERLKDVIQPPAGWGLDELAPLREVLDAARRAGRAIVLTSDHGHILERGSAQRPGGGGGGERWRRTGTAPVGDGEIAVAGPRVVTDDHTAILPWLEQVRYATTRNGYHGGLTLAELAVPLAVLAAEPLAGWEQTDTTPPPWWHPTVGQPDAAPESPPASARQPTRRAPEVPVPSLFDSEPGVSAQPDSAPAMTASGGGLIQRIVANEQIHSQLAALRLDATTVTTILGILNATGGTPLHEDRVADAAGVPRLRIGRLITQIQRLVNIDGYAVVETTNGEVRFDRRLLERQLGL